MADIPEHSPTGWTYVTSWILGLDVKLLTCSGFSMAGHGGAPEDLLHEAEVLAGFFNAAVTRIEAMLASGWRG